LETIAEHQTFSLSGMFEFREGDWSRLGFAGLARAQAAQD
jgi:hypothetical protein